MIFSKQLCGYIQVIEAQIYSQACAEHMEDLVDDYHPDHDIKYPDDLPSKSMMAEFEAL